MVWTKGRDEIGRKEMINLDGVFFGGRKGQNGSCNCSETFATSNFAGVLNVRKMVKKCPICGSSRIKHNGGHKGKLRYKCSDRDKQFTEGRQ